MNYLPKLPVVFLFFLVILSFSVLSDPVGNEYEVGNSVSAIQGTNISGNIYAARTHLSTNTGGDALSTTYQANVGFFGRFRGSPYEVILSGTNYVVAGNNYSINIEINNLSKKNVTVSLIPKISLYDSLKNLIVSNISATLLSHNNYQYNFSTSPTHIAGEWNSTIIIGIDGVTKEYSHNWTITNANTQVIINSIDTNSAPVIKANITIMNEGNLAFEYQYQYCIVDSLLEQCGETTNIDYASGAKQLSVGESWTTILFLNVKEPTNTWFKLVVDYGTQQSGATQSFVASYSSSGSGAKEAIQKVIQVILPEKQKGMVGLQIGLFLVIIYLFITMKEKNVEEQNG